MTRETEIGGLQSLAFAAGVLGMLPAVVTFGWIDEGAGAILLAASFACIAIGVLWTRGR